MQLEFVRPDEIENRSFAIIEEELTKTATAHPNYVAMPENQKLILKRVIHTTADFDYIQNLKFSESAVEKALQALKNGACIITDTNMTLAGIHKKTLRAFGGDAYCFMSDPDVAQQAKSRHVTRAMISMEKACMLQKEQKKKLIFAIGNAPTALYQLAELIREKKILPELIIAVPVGFVNVVESKEVIMRSGVAYIASQGRKGGSTVAAAVCNALLYQLGRIQ